MKVVIMSKVSIQKYEIEDEKVVKYIPAEKNVYTFRWSEYQNGKLVTVMSGKQ